ncbi:hypothetical protein JG688_00007899 [Phytophthora aleatoria]|uniref:Dynein regulatory complex protein 10 n=1 Tax=Phytophthora aleatoria TaxID=2496075 RepID=A0A8J5MFX8_9STRA|nr:hypothetical protein JG688_00007899 [Phytophthora aleatoria]
MSFQGIVWQLLEPKTTFYSPRYNQESLSVRSQALPFWKQPQIVLQLGQTEYLVLNSRPADAAKRSGDPKETKKLLELTVRSLDDVRRAQLYQTAARTQVLEVFVDVEHTRERLLRCLRGGEAVDPGKKVLDDAFEALEMAQQSRDKESAIELYKEAERGFWEAEKLLTDDRSTELLRARRADLQRTIRGLEKEVKKDGDEAQFPPSPAVTIATPLMAEVVTARPPMDISARLEELRRFAAQQDNAKIQAQQENRTDLTARMAALKNEKAGPAPPIDDLSERLRRLKGDNGSTEAVTVVGEGSLKGKSAVDRIIEQVADEIALSIEGEEVESEDLEESDSDGKSESATSVSPAISRLTEAWMQLIINTDAALSTSFEQDERCVLNLRDSMLKLREAEDDRDQVAFELTQAHEGRVAMSDKFTAQRARLEAQLRDTKRSAADILDPTARDREEHLQAALSSFETQNSSAQKQVETIQRTIARVTQASQQVETDERKHTQHAATELRELLRRYDDDMEKLDAEIEEERAEVARLDAANAKFAMHFARIDKDRRNMIEEQRAIDLAEKLRRNREANLFGFVLRMQAVVRGFLTRKHMRLEAQRKKNKSRKGKKGSKGKKRVSKSPRRKKPVKKPSVKARTKKS